MPLSALHRSWLARPRGIDHLGISVSAARDARRLLFDRSHLAGDFAGTRGHESGVLGSADGRPHRAGQRDPATANAATVCPARFCTATSRAAGIVPRPEALTEWLIAHATAAACSAAWCC